MFKIPEDIEIELKSKFPNVQIKDFINSLFRLIIEKTTSDGSCSIREFGKFISFVTTSSRLGKEVIRFKFKVTPALNDKIKMDEYLIKNLPIKAKNIFPEKNKKNCESYEKKQQRAINSAAQKAAGILGKEKTYEKITNNIIFNSIGVNDK